MKKSLKLEIATVQISVLFPTESNFINPVGGVSFRMKREVSIKEILAMLEGPAREWAIQKWKDDVTASNPRYRTILETFLEILYSRGYKIVIEDEPESLRQYLYRKKRELGLQKALEATLGPEEDRLTTPYTDEEEMAAEWYRLVKDSWVDRMIFERFMTAREAN